MKRLIFLTLLLSACSHQSGGAAMYAFGQNWSRPQQVTQVTCYTGNPYWTQCYGR